MDLEDFRWDERKELANERKHGISFVDARYAMRDPAGRVLADATHGPDRFRHLGLDRHGRLILVVTEEMPDGTIRLISARRATKREHDAYTTGFE